MPSNLSPTDEQQAAIDLYRLGDSLVVEAGAGTGKSSTLVLMAQSDPSARVQYTAFNKAIVTDIGHKLPENAAANTAHSLAYRAVVAGNRDLQARLKSGRMRASQVARLLGIDPIVVTTEVSRKVLQPDYLASLAQRAVNVFCQTGDDEPGLRHVPYVEGIDMPDAMGRRTYANNDLVAHEVMGHVRAVWADVQNPQGRLRFEHGHYLKLWERRNPVIRADAIMWDEAQDVSGVMQSIVAQQPGAQVVMVGDPNQAIYEWMGAVDALIRTDIERHTMLTQSFRFGPAIAEIANLILGQLPTEMRLRGLPTLDSEVVPVGQPMPGRPDAILTRTNSGAIEAVLRLQRDGVRVHLVGGGDQIASFTKAAADLMEGRRTSHPDLACFDTWGEVVAYAENDPQGDELRLMVKLIGEYGVAVILAALDGGVPEVAAEVVVSTAHKAKGREWDRVQLATDFPETVESPAEWRLAYVAATRARRVLDPWGCTAIRSLVTPAAVA